MTSINARLYSSSAFRARPLLGRLTNPSKPSLRQYFSCDPNRATVLAMADKYRCAICDKEESGCECDRYCFLCQGGDDVRLCQDGMYYCLDCREACDYQAQY